jgi:hypothetical protein
MGKWSLSHKKLLGAKHFKNIEAFMGLGTAPSNTEKEGKSYPVVNVRKSC